ncbi:hypothetical protein E3P99_01675 [Wallemia hederae]|uniref:D-aminoacyl-tRNA deacylase n=1 Tax=Wallemia hederae TaxID=1540922 RepID=A0A4T0FNP1_9BASI|nr:hypothetical protein E3P99_01675 [Wallemia hederae]
MRVVVQKVAKASVSVDNELVNAIGKGMCLLVGLSVDDTKEDVDWMANKLLKVRLFENGSNIVDNGFEMLSISQFTLHATLKGNALDYHKAMKSAEAKRVYDSFLELLRDKYNAEKIRDGKFGAMMEVGIVNDGPYTIILDSKNRK